MNPKDARYIFDTIENEGFHYAFNHYSDFGNVEDKEFHRLRLNYLDAIEELAEYLGIEPNSI